MSEWWTYRLADLLLFSPRTYYRLFELYHQALWPAQIPVLAAGGLLLGFWRSGDAGRGRLVAVLLALAWLWVAWAFQWQHYAQINWAAEYFAAAFLVEGLLLLGLTQGAGLAASGAAARRAGTGLFLFALLGLPLVALLDGRGWTRAELFALTPDATALGSAALLLAARRARWLLLAIPLSWCLVSAATLWTLGSPQAPILLIAALAVAALSWTKP